MGGGALIAARRGMVPVDVRRLDDLPPSPLADVTYIN